MITRSTRRQALAALAAPLTASLGGFGRADETRGGDRVLSTRIGDVSAEIFLPGGADVIRGLYVHVAHYRLDPRDRWAESARGLGFGHVALNIDLRSTGRVERLRDALDEALERWATDLGRDELRHVPMAGVGHSAGGLVTRVLMKTPARMITTCVDCAWIVDPAELRPEERGIPMLFTLGAIPDAFQMLPHIGSRFEPARAQDLAWSLGLKWGSAHVFGNAAALFVPWLEAIAAARVPRDHRPRGGPVNLAPVSLEGGWLGDRRTIESELPSVAPATALAGDRAQTVWLPNRALAFIWRAFQAKDPAIEICAETRDGKKRLPPPDPAKGRSLALEAGEPVAVSVRPTRPVRIRHLEICDGDTVIGRTRPERPLVWTPRRAGCHVVHALYEGPSGARGASHPVLLTVRRRGASTA